MFEIKDCILQKELKYNEDVILIYEIHYPKIICTFNNCCIQRFNKYNEVIALSLQKKAENELYQDAINLYLYNKENGYPLMQYDIVQKFEITTNQNNLISLYTDEYIFTGGAHGNTMRTSQNWNMNEGCKIALKEICKCNINYKFNIIKSICMQISENPDIYFEDACKLALENFNENNYYLLDQKIVIYFQQYDIAPYSSGILSFVVNC